MQDAQKKEPFDVGALTEDKDVFEGPLAAPKKNLDLDASLIFSEMDRLCEQVTFCKFYSASRSSSF